MRLFLDGVTGFVGSHVARAALARSWEVAGLARPGSDRRRIADIAARLRIIEGRLETPDAWRRALAAFRPDAALQLAWDVTPGRYLADPGNVACVSNALGWLAAVVEAGTSRIVMVGTSLEYARSDRPLAESAPLAPESRYARCKHELRIAAEAIAARLGASFAWARLFHLYGPHEDPRRVVPYVIRSLLAGDTAKVSSGRQVCDYLHVEDAAAALVAVVEADLRGPVNVASGVPIAVRDLITTIADRLGLPDRIAWGLVGPAANMPSYLVADVTRLRSATGWSPRWSLGEGIDQTIRWWREQSSAPGGA